MITKCTTCDANGGFFGVNQYTCINYNCILFKKPICNDCLRKLGSKSGGVIFSKKCPECNVKMKSL
jgi:hypothetical protein